MLGQFTTTKHACCRTMVTSVAIYIYTCTYIHVVPFVLLQSPSVPGGLWSGPQSHDNHMIFVELSAVYENYRYTLRALPFNINLHSCTCLYTCIIINSVHVHANVRTCTCDKLPPARWSQLSGCYSLLQAPEEPWPLTVCHIM